MGSSAKSSARNGVTRNAWLRMHSLARDARAKFLLKVLITATLLILLFRAIDPGLALQRLAAVDPFFLFLAMIFGATQGIIVMSWRWAIVLRVLGGPVPWPRLVQFMTASLFFNQLLPSTIGGDAMRVLLLRRWGRPVGQAVQSVAVERILGLTCLLVLALTGAILLLPETMEHAPMWVVIATAVIALIFAAASVPLSRLGLHLPDCILRRIAEKLNGTITALRRDPARLALLIGLSFLGQFLIFLTVWLVAKSLHVPLGFWHVIAIMPAIILVTSVPVSLAGWGIREGAMVVGLGLVGIPATDAVTVSLVYGLLFLVLGMAAGLTWMLSTRFTSKSALPASVPTITRPF